MRIPCKVCYGVDASPGHTVVVKSTRSGRDVNHENLFSGRAEQATGILRDLRRETDAPGAAIAAALPVRDSTTRWLETPFTSAHKARKVLPSILDVQLPFPLEECVYGFPVVKPSGNGSVRALAVAARVVDVENRLEQLASSEVDPVILDHEGLALWTQSLSEMPAESALLRVVAYAGTDRTVFVVGRGARYLASYNSRHGWGPAMSVPASEGTRPAEWSDLVARIRRILRTHMAGGTEQERIDWIWTGPGVEAGNGVEHLQAQVNSMARLHFRAHRDPTSFLARALSARALMEGPLRWNFRTETRVHPRLRSWEYARRKRVAVACLAAGLVLCALNMGWRVLLQHRDSRAQERLVAEARTVTGMEPTRGQELLDAERSMEAFAALAEPFRRAMQPPLTDTLYRTLRVARESSLAVESMSLREGELLIQGFTDDWDRADLFADRFQTKGWEVSLDRQDALVDERVRYRITAAKQP